MIRMYHSLYTVFIFTMIAVLSTEILGCCRSTSPSCGTSEPPTKTTSIVMPRLREQPQIEAVTTSSIVITWKKDHYGDGSICGYFVSLKSPSSISWANVGYVPFSEEKIVYQYTIDRLDAKTWYGISVAILHCSGGQGERSQELRQETTEYTSPTLLEAPQNTSLTSSSVALRWTNQYQGDGPICGYAIYIRENGNDEPWLSGGFVPVDGTLEFEIDHLESNTAYQVAVALTNCFSAREGPLEPILQIKTLPSVLPTLSEAPQITSLTSSSVALRWTNQHRGEGPICGYVIYSRLDGGEEPWLSVGVLSADVDLEYEIDRLEANTAYQVAVTLINCFSAREGPLEPIVQIRTLPFTLPTLSRAPQIINLTSSTMAVRWTNQHRGEGPICGYVIYIGVNGKEDSWLSVGFVPVDADLEYMIDHLEANTDYQVAVALVNCFSARQGPLEPVLHVRTLPYEVSQSPAVAQNRTTGCPQHKPLNSRHMYWVFAAPALMLVVPVVVLSVLLYKTRKRLRDSKKKRMNFPSNQCSSPADNVYTDIGDVTNDAEYEEIGQRAITDGAGDQALAVMKEED